MSHPTISRRDSLPPASVLRALAAQTTADATRNPHRAAALQQRAVAYASAATAIDGGDPAAAARILLREVVA